jgi:hypothetical protein
LFLQGISATLLKVVKDYVFFSGVHQRQRRFRLQDHLYYIKVHLKKTNNSLPPLLSDLLQLFEEGFSYILTNLSTFYNPNDHNIAFLTLYQEPMINALNTGGFILHDSVNEMVERVLKMLQQFLISNNSLRLNSTFKVYVKVMSIDHMRFREGRKKKLNPKKKYGIKTKEDTEKNPYWLLNVPDGYGTKPNVFKNKCLLTATILGHLQNVFHKSNKKDKRFVYAQNINSKIEIKKVHACKILLNELEELISATSLDPEGPYELENTAIKLSLYFKCQIFIFDAIDNSTKLRFMYPDTYDDKLEPIYLFQPLNNPNHLIFIRHLNSYFKANLKICFYCKKSFRSYRYNHFCVKMKGCFACHRPFATKSTFLHEKNKINFCDKKLASEIPILCNICNITLCSKHCQKGHKRFCCGQGSFGWKCLKCNKFSYRFGNANSKLMEAHHECGIKKCIYCLNDMEENHLCKLKLETFPKSWPLIAFIGIEYLSIHKDNCNFCLTSMNSLTCSNHKSSEIFIEPCLIVIYKEVERGHFKKYVLTSSYFSINDFSEEDSFIYEYVSNDIYHNLGNENKKYKQTFDFDQNFKNLHSKNLSDLSLVNKFVQLISKPEWLNTTFISQDSNSQNYNTILSAFIENGFCPKVIQNGRKISFMEVENFNLRFLTSNSYLEGTEFELAKLYNFELGQYFFPEKLQYPQYFDYNGKVPSIHNFYSFNDTIEVKSQKENFVKTLEKCNYIWNFEKELLRFCDEKLWYLAMSCIKFLEESFNFQILIKKENKIETNELLHPFGYQICSMPGFTFKLYKILYLNLEDIYIVKNEYGFNNKKVSKLEYEWASFMEYKYPENEFQSAFNNPSGQQYFKEAIPDLYSPITKEAHFFHGCKWHGHTNCLLFPNSTDFTKNPVGIDYKSLNDQFLKKASNLLYKNPNKVEKVTIHWECLYLERKKSNEIQYFLNNIFQPHPLRRLCPRLCVRGAYSDTYALKWSEKMFENEDLHFYDVNGLYSYAAISFPFFTGKYNVIIGKDVNNITLNNNGFYVSGKEIYGTMLVTILPPRKLFLPFLLTKTVEGKSINTLCSKCSENNTKKLLCNHSDNERAITDSYFITEIIYALKQGYKLLYIHECHSYETVKFILKDFVEKINVLKLQNSNCFSDCITDVEKEEYCNYLNNEMNLKEPFLLTVKNVVNNSGKRNFFKLMANGFFGKFSQKQNKSKTIFASNQQELEKIYFSDVEIVDIFSLNDEICQVQIKPNDFKLPPNRKGNCYIGGQITAYARQIMHEHLTSVMRAGGTLYQTDTDSICFSLPKHVSNPLLISHCIGHFKNEIDGKIVSYHSLGPKSYSIVFKNCNKFYTITKIRGLSLRSHVNENKLDDNLFEYYLEQYANSHYCKQKIEQSRFKRLRCNVFQIQPLIDRISFTNDVTNKRFIDFKTKNYQTFPYGF